MSAPGNSWRAGINSVNSVEQLYVCRNAGVRREHAIGQSDDGLQVEFLQQFFIDAGAHAVAEQRAVGHAHGGAGVT